MDEGEESGTKFIVHPPNGSSSTPFAPFAFSSARRAKCPPTTGREMK